jgi:hypothetical protein
MREAEAELNILRGLKETLPSFVAQGVVMFGVSFAAIRVLERFGLSTRQIVPLAGAISFLSLWLFWGVESYVRSERQLKERTETQHPA